MKLYFILKNSIKQSKDFTIIYYSYLFWDIKFQWVLSAFCIYCYKQDALIERLKNAAHE